MNVKKSLRLSKLVFVYGTLKKGKGNNYLLRGAKFLGNCFTNQKFLLYNVGYPYAIPNERGNFVKGEVYKINEKIFESLDHLEGYPVHYKRKLIYCTRIKDLKIFKCWIYYTKYPTGEKLIAKKDKKTGLYLVQWD